MDVIWAVGIPASFCACALLSTLCCYTCYKRHGKIAELEARARKHDMEKMAAALATPNRGGGERGPGSLLERVKALAKEEAAAAAAAAGAPAGAPAGAGALDSPAPAKPSSDLMERVQAHAAKGGLIPGTAMVDGVAAPPPVSVPKSPGIPTTAAQVVRLRLGVRLRLRARVSVRVWVSSP